MQQASTAGSAIGIAISAAPVRFAIANSRCSAAPGIAPQRKKVRSTNKALKNPRREDFILVSLASTPAG